MNITTVKAVSKTGRDFLIRTVPVPIYFMDPGLEFPQVSLNTVGEGNFEHLFNFEANLKICQIFFHQFFLA